MKTVHTILALICVFIIGYAIYNIVDLLQTYEESADTLLATQNVLNLVAHVMGWLIIITILIVALLKNRNDFFNRD